MADVINAVSGNKMFQLKQGIKELRERLKVEEDPDVIAGIKKEIMEMRQQMMKVKDSLKWMEMETHYNILADRLKMQDRGI